MAHSIDSVYAAIDQAIERRFDELVELRRDIHRHPELAWHEERTTGQFSKFLANHGIDSSLGPRQRGLIANFSSGDCPGVFAFRGDIDAIPVEEETGLEYASLNTGIMHACGHDIHGTVVAGTLLAIKDLVDQQLIDFPIAVRGIFQPAEEIAQGAREMIEVGAMDNVQAIVAMHIDPTRVAGKVGLSPGVHTAACDQLNVFIDGIGGHGARPHETCDPIYAAADWIKQVYSRLQRSIDSRDPVAISICEMKGGSTVNVIPKRVKLRGTLRTLSTDSRKRCLATLQQISEAVADLSGTSIKIEWGDAVPPIVNSPEVVDLLNFAAKDYLDDQAVESVEPSMGSEDFSCFGEKAQAAMIRIGSRAPGSDCFPLHSAHLTVDESTIKIACNIMVRAAIRWWSGAARS